MVVSRTGRKSVFGMHSGGLHIDVEVESEPARALTKLTKSKVDALIVDCDLKRVAEPLRHLQENGRHSNPIPLVISERFARPKRIRGKGCDLQLRKADFCGTSGAHPFPRLETLYWTDASLSAPGAGSTYLRNIRSQKTGFSSTSQTLARVGWESGFKRGLEMRGPVRVCFELPKTKLAVKAAGEIAWTDQLGNTGVRFVPDEQRTAQDLKLWLAQQYFRE